MATQSTTAKNPVAGAVTAATASLDESIERAQNLGEKFVDTAKVSGNLALDVYEQTVSSIVDFDRSLAKAAKLDWVTAVVDARASLVQSISSAATTAARTALA
ncbi:hypothetical protein [Prescottella sp. R16]|uniref:hypothetical protein n=1 Tax=Prescottella sp. R16 TaxID=3064529 RepID=UPI00272DEDA4|nr:hypothetical protein [Prescottella sp. R16]